MATRTQTQKARADHLVALPSLSCALSSLPQAKSFDQVSLHQATLTHRSVESEAKLRKALAQNSVNGYNSAPLVAPTPKQGGASEPTSPNCPSPPPLMMRPHKSKIRT